MAAGQIGVADHHEIGRRLKLLGVEAFVHLDVRPCKLIAHGRIQRPIGTGDPPSLLAGKLCQAPHERAADAQEMDVTRFQDLASDRKLARGHGEHGHAQSHQNAHAHPDVERPGEDEAGHGQ